MDTGKGYRTLANISDHGGQRFLIFIFIFLEVKELEKWFSEKKKIDRNYLEINSVKELIEPKYDLDKYSFELVRTDDFQLNRFYKEVGRNHNWLDRLNWTDEQWIKYISDKKIKTYV